MSYELQTEVSFADTGNIDAFGRLRVSQVTTQYDAKQIYDNLPLFVDEELIGTATSVHSTTLAKTTLTAPANGDAAILQTKQRFNYQSGKSNLIFMTFKNLGEGESVSVVTSRSGTETKRDVRDDWDDRLDGTGASGITHDFDNNTIFAIDYEWLGVGRVRYYIIKNGALINFHSVDFTDTTDVYMSSPNQPLRWECKQTAPGAYYNRVGYFSTDTTTPFNTVADGIWIESISGTGTLDVICSSVNTEGAVNQIGKIGGADDDKTNLNATSTSSWYFAQAIKLKSTHCSSIVDILDLELFASTNDDFAWRVCLNPTYSTTGSTPTWTAITNYSVEIGIGTQQNTASTFGTVLASGYGNKESITRASIDNAIKLGSKIDGTVDEIVVFVSGLTVGLDIYRAINWRELS